MPTVPLRNGPSVELGMAAPAKQTAQMDAGVIQAQTQMMGAASKLADTVSKAQDQADQLIVLEKRREFERAKTKALFDEKEGALFAQGKNAFEAQNKANEMLSKTGQELAESLSNEKQKALFNNYLGNEEVDINRRLTIHTSQEIRKHDEDLTRSSLDSLLNRAMTDFSNPNKIAENLAEQEILLRQMGERNGLAPEIVDSEILRQKSTTHINILAKMASNQMDIGASKYFAAVKESMTEADQIKAGNMLKESSYRGQSQRIVDSFTNNNLSLDDALKESSKIQDPRLREEVEQRYMRVNSLKEAAKNQFQDNVQMAALNLIDKGQGIDAIPVEQWSQLDDTRRKGIMNYLSAKASGKDKKTDWEVYYDLKEKAGSDPATFQKVNLLDYQEKLSNSDLKKLIDLQTGIKGGKKGLLDGFMSDQQVVKAAMEEAGIKNKKDQAEFMAIIDTEATIRKPKDNNELRRIVNEKLTRVITDKGFLWDTTKFQYQVDPEKDQIQGVKYDTIPQEERLKITELLKSKNLPVSEKSITEIYTFGIKKQMNGR